jgi:hypothetical protein
MSHLSKRGFFLRAFDYSAKNTFSIILNISYIISQSSVILYLICKVTYKLQVKLYGFLKKNNISKSGSVDWHNWRYRNSSLFLFPLQHSITNDIHCLKLHPFIFTMIIITEKFLRWFIFNKKNRTLLIYALATLSISINLIITLCFVLSVVNSWNPTSPAFRGTTSIYIISGSLSDNLNYYQSLTLIVSFSLTWYATLTPFFKQIVRRNKLYLILLFMPLLYFQSQYISVFYNLFAPLILEGPYGNGNLFTTIFTFSKLAGGILFGLVFWIMSKKIAKEYPVKEYLVITTFGLNILFISNQAVLLTSTPFPPFDLASVSTVGFSTFLIFIGIYLSAISISKDKKLRSVIKRIALQYNTNLLENIGSAQIYNEIEEKVVKILKEQKNNENSNEETAKTDSKEVKRYINEILDEVKEKK